MIDPEVKDIVDDIIDNKGSCFDRSSEDCYNICPCSILCSSHSNITDAMTLKWMLIIKKNKYKVPDNLLFEELL